MHNLRYKKKNLKEYEVWNRTVSKLPDGTNMGHEVMIGRVTKTASGKYWIPVKANVEGLYKTRQAAAVELLND